MHELSIVQALIEQVEQEVEQSGHAGRVTRLSLIVGRLSGVNADSLRFAFEMLAPDTLVESAQVEIAQPKAVCRCAGCGETTEIDELLSRCPECDSNDITYEGGQDLLLESIDLEE